jgi:hypothetical protein
MNLPAPRLSPRKPIPLQDTGGRILAAFLLP